MTEKQIPPHLQRMLEEEAQLSDRIRKAQAYLLSEISFDHLDDTDRHLLTQQVSFMSDYAQVLLMRINRARIRL